MTVEDLLKQLKRERMNAMADTWKYGSEAQEAMIHGDHELAKAHEQVSEEADKKDQRLSMIIKEIEKRVS